MVVDTNNIDDDKPEKLIYVIDLSAFYHAFEVALDKQCQLLDCDEDERQQIKEALVTRMMAHILEFQRNNDLAYLERSSQMAINILREYYIKDIDQLSSAWLPILLYATGLFLKGGFCDISRVWELKACIGGVLHISPT